MAGSDDSDNGSETNSDNSESRDTISIQDDAGEDGGTDKDDDGDDDTPHLKKRKIKLSKKDVKEFEREQRKRGIVYLARIPPHVTPSQIRELLSRYGELDRIYLVPEDRSITKRRAHMGGTKKVHYIEGWVEFKDKRIAQLVARCLNNQRMGGDINSRAFYKEDLWNIKYLRKYKWSGLQEKLSFDRVTKNQRIEAERRQAHKESEFYIARVSQANEWENRKKQKSTKQIPTKQTKKTTAASTTTEETTPTPQAATKSKKNSAGLEKIVRSFSQRRAAPDPTQSDVNRMDEDVLRKIFPQQRTATKKAT